MAGESEEEVMGYRNRICSKVGGGVNGKASVWRSTLECGGIGRGSKGKR